MGWSQDLFRALWRALSKEAKEQVGTDRFGNKYYYVPGYRNWRGWNVLNISVKSIWSSGSFRIIIPLLIFYLDDLSIDVLTSRFILLTSSSIIFLITS
uniref:NADH dehydrogenase [ubiquinone] 1 alpha subcomplex assembly factor 2 n=1 Tax=Felis catus TaxID=9685 RepID=A0ABI7Y8W1_FELCA